MTFHALLLAAALAAAQDAFKDIDGLIREAETSVLVLETLGTKEKPGCPPGVTLRTVVQDYQQGRLTAEAARLLFASQQPLLKYYGCRALAAGSSQPCSELRAFKVVTDFVGKPDKKFPESPETFEFLCVSGYTDMAMAKGGISGDKALVVRACKEHDTSGNHDFRPERLDAGCKVVAEKFGQPEAICAAIGPMFRMPVAQKYCVNEMRMIMGVATSCESFSPDSMKAFCEANAAYRKAFAAKSAAQCGDSALCRAMFGDGQACESMAAGTTAQLCYMHYNHRFASTEHASLKTKLEHLNKVLGSVDPSKLPGGTATVLQLEQRIEKLARLQVRADHVLSRFPSAPKK